jgi:hypothetical protein
MPVPCVEDRRHQVVRVCGGVMCVADAIALRGLAGRE